MALHPCLRREVTFPKIAALPPSERLTFIFIGKVAACRLRNASILLWQYKRAQTAPRLNAVDNNFHAFFLFAARVMAMTAPAAMAASARAATNSPAAYAMLI